MHIGIFWSQQVAAVVGGSTLQSLYIGHSTDPFIKYLHVALVFIWVGVMEVFEKNIPYQFKLG